ncbi:MAG: biotin/lipoyl-containing protein [Sphaerochaeta sp.]
MDSIEHMDLASVIALFEESSLGEMELTCSRYSLKFKRQGEGSYVASAPVAGQKTPKAEKPVAGSKSEESGVIETITSPIVGTFYLTPAPDAPAYVQVGDLVEEGGIICTIEAMKMMNQLQTDFPCEIVSVLAKPEEMVEFGQPLFTVRRR